MLQVKKQSSPFDSFTNLYSLSKTLRFELKPTPETEELLKKTNLQGRTPVQSDQEIDELYHKEMKPLFDQLHEKFITQALSNLKFDAGQLQSLEKNYLELKRLNKEKKNNASEIKKLTDANTGKIPRLEKELRELIVKQFNKLGEEWKAKYPHIKLDDKGYKILTNAKILQVLLTLYPEKSNFIKKFERFFTYFSSFNQNRENYYTYDAKATGVADRIINTNLPIFFDNKQKFEKIIGKVPALKKYERYFELENYQNYFIQGDIDDFNENIIGKINSDKNLFCQQENTKPENKNSKLYLPNLNRLQKQIGCKTKQQREQEKKGESIYPKCLEKVGLGFQITQDQGKYQVWEALEYLTKELKSKIKKVRENYQNFFNNPQEYKLDEIWFRKESINTISGRWFGGDNWTILTKALDYSGTGKLEKGEYKIPVFVSLLDLKEALEP